MTLWRCFTLAYLVVAGVFSVLLATSEEWAETVQEHPHWIGSLARFFVLIGFGCIWPAVALFWLLA